ncbi:hypothetical protein Tco_1366254, partial [Tanacetum coccineum]
MFRHGPSELDEEKLKVIRSLLQAYGITKLTLNFKYYQRRRWIFESSTPPILGNGYSRKGQKESQKQQSQARNGKDKVKSRP